MSSMIETVYQLTINETFGKLSQTNRNRIIQILSAKKRGAEHVFVGTFDATSGIITAHFTDEVQARAAAFDVETKVGYCNCTVAKFFDRLAA